jgi:hypothetical protein
MVGFAWQQFALSEGQPVIASVSGHGVGDIVGDMVSSDATSVNNVQMHMNFITSMVFESSEDIIVLVVCSQFRNDGNLYDVNW